jgi:hypothetical protein
MAELLPGTLAPTAAEAGPGPPPRGLTDWARADWAALAEPTATPGKFIRYTVDHARYL